jgi:hypothetical protein
MLKARNIAQRMFARFQRSKGLCEFECGWECSDYDCAVRLCNRAAQCLEHGLFNTIELCKEHSKLLVPRTHRRKSMFNLIGF